MRRAPEIVDRVVTSMHDNLGEHFVTDDMARTARYSKFHFSRLFQRTAGVSPGRLLTILRLQEAKRLLACTTMSVADIGHRIGYSSIGTFGSRFREEVGMTPAAYRRARQLPARWLGPDVRLATLRGELRVPPGSAPGLIFVGLFPDPVPRGAPVRCTMQHRPGPYAISHVPPGTWHLAAHSVSLLAGTLTPGAQSMLGEGAFRQEDVLSAGTHGPIVVRAGIASEPVDVDLRAITGANSPALALIDFSTSPDQVR